MARAQLRGLCAFRFSFDDVRSSEGESGCCRVWTAVRRSYGIVSSPPRLGVGRELELSVQ